MLIVNNLLISLESTSPTKQHNNNDYNFKSEINTLKKHANLDLYPLL